MAGKSAILSVRIVSDAKEASKGFNDTEKGIDKLEKKLGKLTPVALAALGGLGLAAKGAVDSASALQQSVGGVEAVFKDQAATMLEWSEAAADSVGLAKSEYNDLATVLGAQLKNMGIESEKLGGQTNDLIGLGADLAAQFGGSTADAVSALTSLLRGERDPIEKYGVSIKQADIAARMAADGLDGLEGEAAKAAETQTVLALLTEQTADAHGAFARETDTAAGAAQIASANFENAKAALGEHLLPVVTAVTQELGEFAKWASQNSDAVLMLGGVVAGLATTVLAANAALKVYRATAAAVNAVIKIGTGIKKLATAASFAERAATAAASTTTKAATVATATNTATTKAATAATKGSTIATKAATVAQKAMNLALRMNPFGLVITLIAALAAGLVAAYKKSETFRNFVNKLWSAIKSGASAAARAVQPIVSIFQRAASAVQGMINKVRNLFSGFKPPAWMSSIGRWFSGAAAATAIYASAAPDAYAPQLVQASAAPSLFSLARATGNGAASSGGAPSINITVNGALDPDAVARQIERLLIGRAWQRGTVAVA